jgi:hypothetical protein
MMAVISSVVEKPNLMLIALLYRTDLMTTSMRTNENRQKFRRFCYVLDAYDERLQNIRLRNPGASAQLQTSALFRYAECQRPNPLCRN